MLAKNYKRMTEQDVRNLAQSPTDCIKVKDTLQLTLYGDRLVCLIFKQNKLGNWRLMRKIN